MCGHVCSLELTFGAAKTQKIFSTARDPQCFTQSPAVRIVRAQKEVSQNFQLPVCKTKFTLVRVKHVGEGIDVLFVPLSDVLGSGVLDARQLQDLTEHGVQLSVAARQQRTPPPSSEDRQHETKTFNEPHIELSKEESVVVQVTFSKVISDERLEAVLQRILEKASSVFQESALPAAHVNGHILATTHDDAERHLLFEENLHPFLRRGHGAAKELQHLPQNGDLEENGSLHTTHVVRDLRLLVQILYWVTRLGSTAPFRENPSGTTP